ncbi:sulfotransferase family protein [Phycisphaera mikurensis]|uniref:Sulfotransferase n=1 Tax=Phycisphaera mikurensis (strain NBRC 102666 / KCTC 22515 / FYK2301M01) TaxID=1142394 RepID=I0IHN9_PHYMF|nr:sulfotransferase [Phycisphaera mikurensis]MBB6441022.1 hypothetical protein [Phycisphaera mikurensis]BAM04777.1 hypothetical protein PSMK_26180 [Phycisphaera mikurensis NBRC 102666]
MTAPTSFLFGSGRSGTVVLLRLINLDPGVVVRNEPDELSDSPLGRALGQSGVRDDANDGTAIDVALDTSGGFGRRFDEALAAIRTRRGTRDHPWATRKAWHRPIPLKLLNAGLKAGLRQRLQRGREAWEVPGWAADRAALAAAPLSVKINNGPALARWLAAERPDLRAMEIVRHPGGFLASWRARWLNRPGVDPAAVLAKNRARLAAVAAAEPAWGERWGDPAALDVDASELWYWRYSNEAVLAAYAGDTRLLPIGFERFCREPQAHAEAVYRHLGLPYTDRVRAGVAAEMQGSTEIASAWKQKLGPERVALVEAVLAGSPLADLVEA